MSEQFYRAFEDRYRGSRELIKDRLRVYLDFISPLASLSQQPAALDLGCGRGEWLELLSEHSFAARGVDLDSGMLAACRERELSVETMDAISALKALPENSLALVSAFHLVEHLPFAVLQDLVSEALRVLVPGGLLIMETPNPENPLVGACRFYLDPSHLKPLPPLLLSFLAEYAGFAVVKTVRLQEDPSLHTDKPLRLINVLDGASPDYSVIAQKAAPEEVLKLFKEPFGREFGLSLSQLAERFDEANQQQSHRLSETTDQQYRQLSETTEQQYRQLSETTEQRYRQLSETFEQQHRQLSEALEQRQQQLSAMAMQFTNCSTQLLHVQEHGRDMSKRLAELSQQLATVEARVADTETSRTQLEAELAAANQQLEAVFASSSWRVTKPFRWLGRLFR